LQQIIKARLQGYAIESNEISLGITAISVPIKNYSCPIALTIAGMENEIKKSADKLLKSLLNTSKIISNKLSMASNKLNYG
jgi:DNA-binding IclR family transcriptional regulator